MENVFFLFVVLGLLVFVLWVWSLIHCISNQNLSDNNRIIGILLIVLLGIVGSFAYLFLPQKRPMVQGKRERIPTRPRNLDRTTLEDSAADALGSMSGD